MLAAAQTAWVQAVQAAPRQLVVVVAEGLSPQVLDIGSTYIKTAAQGTADEDASSAISEMKAMAKASPATPETLSSLRGLLKNASANGYHTGLVSTADVAGPGALFYDLPADADAASTLVGSTKFDFLAGGGRSGFVSKQIPGSTRSDALDPVNMIRNTGGTALFNADSVEDTELQIKGKALVLQADAELPYAIDQNPERGAGLGELAALAVQTLAGENDAPFVLVIHDTLLAKAVTSKDTPAMLEEFRELDGIVGNLVGFREAKDNPSSVAIALLATGGDMAPRFTSESAQDRSNALFVASQLPMSYTGAGMMLKGASATRLDEFATEQYKGWKLSEENRAAILAGTMTPEAAIRASYEPSIALTYEAATAAPMLYSVGIAGDDIVSVINQMAMSRPGAAMMNAATTVPAM